jgi:elongation factor Ts
MQMIKQLREKTGVGIIDCKKALEETNNDIEAAVELLRKKGIAKAGKRQDRETNEGVIFADVNNDNTEAYILEANSETDFVANNDKFQKLIANIFELIKSNKPADLDELNGMKLESANVSDEIDNLSGVIGEKIKINSFKILKGVTVGAYLHMNKKTGAIVSFDKAVDVELANSIAMHITAMTPEYVSRDEVPQENIDKEKEIYKEELINSGKPANILDKIIVGKINKYLEEICLVEQEYIKEDKKKIKEVLGDANVEKFIKYSLS